MRNLFELLVTSEDDSRYNDWLQCFKILFGIDEGEIANNIDQIKQLINIRRENVTNSMDYYDVEMGDSWDNKFFGKYSYQYYFFLPSSDYYHKKFENETTISWKFIEAKRLRVVLDISTCLIYTINF